MLDYARPAGVAFAPGSLAEQALATLAPDDADPSRRFDRGLLLIQAGRLDEAERLFLDLLDRGERLDRGFLASSQVRYHLARVAALRGETERAVTLLVEASDASPGDPFVLAQLAALTGDSSHERTLARYFSELDALFLVGIAQLENGTQDQGVANLSEVARRVPELWRARIYLSAALGARGDLDEAARQYREAMASRSEPAMLEASIVPIFAGVAARAPTDARTQYEYGLVLEQFGRFGAALEALRTAQAHGGGPEVQRAVERVTALRERVSGEAEAPPPDG
jgi:Flp pilus assembly protein TadD